VLEGSQATPARPYGRNNVKVKTLWLQTNSEILYFEFLIFLSIIWGKNRLHPQQGVILMSLKSGGLHEKHAVATWIV
jgi:hypothetical protein